MWLTLLVCLAGYYTVGAYVARWTYRRMAGNSVIAELFDGWYPVAWDRVDTVVVMIIWWVFLGLLGTRALATRLTQWVTQK